MPNPSTIENSEVPETSSGSEVTAATTIDQPADAVPESASASSVTSPVGGEGSEGESVVVSMATDSPAPSSSPAEVAPAPVEAVAEVTPVAAVTESTEAAPVASEVTPEVIPETPVSTSPVAPPEASEPVVVIGGGGFEVPVVMTPEVRQPTMLERIEALELRVAALENGVPV